MILIFLDVNAVQSAHLLRFFISPHGGFLNKFDCKGFYFLLSPYLFFYFLAFSLINFQYPYILDFKHSCCTWKEQRNIIGFGAGDFTISMVFCSSCLLGAIFRSIRGNEGVDFRSNNDLIFFVLISDLILYFLWWSMIYTLTPGFTLHQILK